MSNIYILEPPTSGKVVMKTTVGDIDLELWTKEASKACRNFIQLCMEGYYDNTIFHRVVKGFIVQGGDPTGTGEGGESIYGEPFKDEFHTRLRFCRRGLLAMANSGKDDNGSQFFFTLAATPELQNKHTIFGKVTGETVFNMIKLEDSLVDENEKPIYPQKILKTQVLNNPFNDIVPRVVKKDIVEEKIKKRKKKGVKDFKLLSFGEEAEEDEEESVELSKQLGSKSKSAHDNLSDPKLSSEPVIASDEPPNKRKKKDDTSHSENDSDLEKVDDTEKREMTERIKNKLKISKSSSIKKLQDEKVEHKDDNVEEEYYLGKDREDERKRQTEEIKKEIRDFKREIKKEQMKKLDDEKQEMEKKEKSKKESKFNKTYYEEKEKYKKEILKIPKKGASREDFSNMYINKFKNRIKAMKNESKDNESLKLNNKKDEDEDYNVDNEPTEYWMIGPLNSTDKAPVLAKDASTKGDDWFEIYDPRNPLNKRRRGEATDKSKSDGRYKK